MSLSYPIAENGLSALTEPQGHARTRSLARAEVGQSVTFETDWLRPSREEAEDLQPAVLSAAATGAAQVYESDAGEPIIAISYWKITNIPEMPEVRVNAGESKRPREDHADDLYFRKGRTKKSKKAEVDPNQLDLFGAAAPETDKD